MAYANFVRRAGHAAVLEGESIVVGGREWDREPGGVWRRGRYGGGLPFRTRSWFTWTSYAQAVRLLRTSGRLAVVALMDPGTPAWWQVTIDRVSGRVVRDRLITNGHFTTHRFGAFDRPARVAPPR